MISRKLWQADRRQFLRGRDGNRMLSLRSATLKKETLNAKVEIRKIIGKRYIMNLTAECLGQQIPFLRKKAGISQEDLAQMAGISRTAVQGIESGKESLQLDTLLKVCHVLNIRLSLYHSLLPQDTI